MENLSDITNITQAVGHMDFQTLAIAIVQGVFGTELVKRFIPKDKLPKKNKCALFACISVGMLILTGVTVVFQPQWVKVAILTVTVGTGLYDSVVKTVMGLFDYWAKKLSGSVAGAE
jgi:hypothetical protein